MEYLFLVVLTVWMLYFFVCAWRVTIRQSYRNEVTTFSHVKREMLLPVSRLMDKLFGPHPGRPKN